MQLRPYQQLAREAVEREWDEGRGRTLLVLPTGTGKTIVFAAIAEDMARRGQRGLVLAHRGELLDQAADKIYRATGMRCAVEKAESTSIGALNMVTVGSVQSLMQDKRLERFDRDRFGWIVVDEALQAGKRPGRDRHARPRRPQEPGRVLRQPGLRVQHAASD